MSLSRKDPGRIEFGDFQTPPELAARVVRALGALGWDFSRVIEPTCGTGAFLCAVLESREQAPNPDLFLSGWDINAGHIERARGNLAKYGRDRAISLRERNVFQIDWEEEGEDLAPGTLFLGNPPWVTNSSLSSLNASNLPKKSNFQKRSGYDALTGKSNFDVSEWLLIQIANLISGRDAAMAFIVKTSVARKIFRHAVAGELSLRDFRIYRLDARKNFGVAANACLFFARGVPEPNAKDNISRGENVAAFCSVHDRLENPESSANIGCLENRLIADSGTYAELRDLDAGSEFPWRSGIKHDCSSVMILTRENSRYRNGLGQIASLPDDYLYPLCKGSDIAPRGRPSVERFVLVTQKNVGEQTDSIRRNSRATWEYLESHRERLDGRKSVVYRRSPPFSIFGVGRYSFLPWKTAISGLYKDARFTLIGPRENKPVMLDDTCYFLSFRSPEEAHFVLRLLNSGIARRFLDALIFRDNKRPITASLLNRLSLKALAGRLDLLEEYIALFGQTKVDSAAANASALDDDPGGVAPTAARRKPDTSPDRPDRDESRPPESMYAPS